MTRVMVVDDHPLFRKGLVALLRASGLDVVAEAASGTEAITLAAEETPDLILMDLGLPDMGGVAATARIVATRPTTKVLVISLYDDERSVRGALEAGASGYVLKDASPEQILAALDAVAMGALWLGTGVPRPIVGAAPATAPSLQGFTPREAAIAELIGKGLPNPVIAERLGLSAKTVANYVSTVLLKLGAEDRLDAARIVRAHGETPIGGR